jgi:hypothetical protein
MADTFLDGALTSSPLTSGPLTASDVVPDDTAFGTIYAYSTVVAAGFSLSAERRVIVPYENRTVIIPES